MSKENYVRNPDLNRKIDYKANALMQLREIYYVVPFNAFMCVKRIAPNGKKVYSGLCNFMDDSTTYIENMHVSDEYVAKNCIRLTSIEELDKYAFQRDLSLDINGTHIKMGAYCVREDSTEAKEVDFTRYVLLHTGVYQNPNFTKLQSDPMIVSDFDMMDWPDMDDRDDYLLDD